MEKTHTQSHSEHLEESPNPKQKEQLPDQMVASEADLKRTESNRKKCRKWRLKNIDREKRRLKQWHLENKQKERDYRVAHKDYLAQRKKEWRAANPHKLKEENRKAKERKNKWLSEWRKNNPEKNKQYGKNAQPAKRLLCSKKRATDPQFVMAERLRARLGVAIGRQIAKKYKTTFALLGCPLPDFMLKMEALFCFGMSWSNRAMWHLDHIVPVKWFNLLDEEEQAICFNWKNFEPLWGKENLRKGHALPDPLPDWLPPHIAERIMARSVQPKHPHS